MSWWWVYLVDCSVFGYLSACVLITFQLPTLPICHFKHPGVSSADLLV